METPAQYSVKKSYTFGPVVRKDTFAFLSNSENGQRKDDLMHAFPNTTFEHNHAPVVLRQKSRQPAKIVQNPEQFYYGPGA